MNKKKKKLGTMDTILVIIYLTFLVFTVAMIICYFQTGGIPDTLVTCVFGALGGEYGAMGVIKIAKIRHEDRKWQIEDREYEKENL